MHPNTASQQPPASESSESEKDIAALMLSSGYENGDFVEFGLVICILYQIETIYIHEKSGNVLDSFLI